VRLRQREARDVAVGDAQGAACGDGSGPSVEQAAVEPLQARRQVIKWTEARRVRAAKGDRGFDAGDDRSDRMLGQQCEQTFGSQQRARKLVQSACRRELVARLESKDLKDEARRTRHAFRSRNAVVALGELEGSLEDALQPNGRSRGQPAVDLEVDNVVEQNCQGLDAIRHATRQDVEDVLGAMKHARGARHRPVNEHAELFELER
jgi:hypothetical protein